MTDLAAWIAAKRAASEGATEGPWWPDYREAVKVCDKRGSLLMMMQFAHGVRRGSVEVASTARHIAAFDPATTRRLLDVVEVLAAFVEKVEAGKARSTDTYNRAKAALDALRGGDHG